MTVMKTLDGNKDIKIGDFVGFKCDIEQYGEVVKIEHVSGNVYKLFLENDYGFEGAYIGGAGCTTEYSSDCWVD